MIPVPGKPIEEQPESVVLRMLLWGEARGEKDAGGTLESVAMLAVAWVVLNRARKHKMDLKAVILQPWQFSCFNASDPNRKKMLTAAALDMIAWERADTVADLFESGMTTDPTKGATHYVTSNLWNRADSSKPQWYESGAIASGVTKETVRIGHHVFANTL